MSGVKGKSGRKRKTLTREQALMSLTKRLPKAIQVIEDTMEGVNNDRLRYEAAVEVKDSVMGKPKIQAEVTNKGEIGIGLLPSLMEILAEGRKRLEAPVVEGEYKELSVTEGGNNGPSVTEGADTEEGRALPKKG